MTPSFLFQKYLGPGCSPFPFPVKKWFVCHVSGCLCKCLDWVYRCEDFTFHFTSYFVQVDDISEYSCEFFCAPISCFILIYHSSLLFFIYHHVVGKPFRFFIMFTNQECFLNESNFLSSLRVYSVILLGKMFKQLLYKYRYQRLF